MKRWHRRVAFFDTALTRPERRAKLMVLAGLLALLTAAFFYESTPLHGVILCPLRATTGMECAGCGMTRSWCAFATAEWATSRSAHPFGPLLFVLAACKSVALGVELLRDRALVIPLWSRVRAPALGLFLIGLLALGLYRAANFLL